MGDKLKICNYSTGDLYSINTVLNKDLHLPGSLVRIQHSEIAGIMWPNNRIMPICNLKCTLVRRGKTGKLRFVNVNIQANSTDFSTEDLKSLLKGYKSEICVLDKVDEEPQDLMLCPTDLFIGYTSSWVTELKRWYMHNPNIPWNNAPNRLENKLLRIGHEYEQSPNAYDEYFSDFETRTKVLKRLQSLQLNVIKAMHENRIRYVESVAKKLVNIKIDKDAPYRIRVEKTIKAFKKGDIQSCLT